MQNGNLKLSVNGFEFEFSKQEIESLQVLETSQKQTTALLGNSLYKGKVSEVANKTFETGTQGRTFQVKIKDNLDQLIDSLGLSKPKTSKLSSIKAPMPGLVIQIAVEEGQTVAENDKILILEAMKMENVLRIPHDATIKKVLVKSGQAVDKGQVLIELE